jgi:DNA-binding IclR family transcriptional regulator
MKPERRPNNRHTIDRGVSQSVARALSVLDLLGDTGEDIGVREIARRLKLAPSIAQRLLATLAAGGYVERALDGQKYRIGYRAFQVGRVFLTKTDLHRISLPELRAMAEHDQINSYLGVLRDGSIVYLEAVQSHGPIAITSAPGSRGELHSTAFGKALLSELSDQEVAQILGEGPFRALTVKTKTSLAALLKDLRDVRRIGYAISDQENLDNVFAVGAVVRDACGQAVAAISGAVPRNQLQSTSRENLCQIVTQAAERISRRLGHVQDPSQSSRSKREQERTLRC